MSIIWWQEILNNAKNELTRDRKRPFREPSDAGSDEFNEMKKIHSDTGKILSCQDVKVATSN